MSLEAFNLPEDATEEQVRARYKELAKKAHPDLGGSEDEFNKLTEQLSVALKEAKFGSTLGKARMQLNALREAARGTVCPRCDGTGVSTRRQIGFREFKTVCRLCHGKGKLS